MNIEVSSPEFVSPTRFTNLFSEITPGNVLKLEEVTLLPSNNYKKIVALSESFDKQYIQAVSLDNFLRRWDVEHEKVVSELNIGSAGIKSTNFNKNGQWLATSGIKPSIGFQIFDVETGKLLECKQANICPNDYGITYIQQILIPNGQMLINYTIDDGVIIPVLDWGREIDFGSTEFLANDCLFRDGFDDFHRSLHFRAMAISFSQKYLASILEGGIVCIREMQEISSINMQTGFEIPLTPPAKQQHFPRLRFEMPVTGDESIQSLTFDPSNQWLAALTNNDLIVWDLTEHDSPLKIHFPVTNGNTLSFDRSGRLLVIGEEEKIIIVDVHKGKKIIEFTSSPVSTLYFTRDNRMLVWGDVEGNVHLWGVPQK